MDYMTLKEASEKWGVTTRWINYLCTAGRIPGAVKMGTVWLIPNGTHQTEQFHILDAINVYSQIGEAGQNTYE